MIKIYRSDNKNTRNAKKRFRKGLKRKKKSEFLLKIRIIEAFIERSNLPKKKKKSLGFYSHITYSSDIEKFYQSNKHYNKKNRKDHINLNSEVGLFEDPMFILMSLLDMLNSAKRKQYYITVSLSKGASMSSLYFIDTICWEIASSKKWMLKIEGQFPDREKEIITCLRSFITGKIDNKYAYIVNSKIKINRGDSKLAKQTHKEKSTEVRRLIQRGINETINPLYTLSSIEHNAIDSAISEHFDNILLHVPEAEFGHLCSIYDKFRNEIVILIYNFGRTIAESLERDTIPEEIRREIESVITNFTKKGFFNQNSKFTKENALTLLAIQEGVSSKLKYDKSRGHGLMDFIQHCKELNPESKIVIISGKTAIKIDKKYEIGQEDVLGRIRRIIALNDENDIFSKPNDDYVINMGINFPGVIIETRIPLNHQNEN